MSLMRGRSKSPQLQNLTNEEIEEKVAELKNKIELKKQYISEQETLQKQLYQTTKENQKVITQVYNDSKQINGKFMSRLQRAIQKKDQRQEIFNKNDPFINKNYDEILECLKNKGYQIPKRSSSKSISSRVGSRKSLTQSKKNMLENSFNNNSNMTQMSSNQSQGKQQFDYEWITKEIQTQNLRSQSSYFRAIFYAKKLNQVIRQ